MDFDVAAILDMDVAAVRVVLRGDLAALVRFAVELLLLPEEERPVVERPRPGADAFDRAEAVARDAEDVLRLPLDEVEVFTPPLRPAAAFLVELLLEVERPPVVFFGEPVEVFFVELLAERLRVVAAAPFLPAVLFFADEEVLDPPVDFFVVEDDFLAAEDLDPAAEVFFFAPPEDERAEVELFFAPTLLLEPDDEREPVDFFVVAMRIIPPKKCVFLSEEQIAKGVPCVSVRT